MALRPLFPVSLGLGCVMPMHCSAVSCCWSTLAAPRCRILEIWTSAVFTRRPKALRFVPATCAEVALTRWPLAGDVSPCGVPARACSTGARSPRPVLPAGSPRIRRLPLCRLAPAAVTAPRISAPRNSRFSSRHGPAPSSNGRHGAVPGWQFVFRTCAECGRRPIRLRGFIVVSTPRPPRSLWVTRSRIGGLSNVATVLAALPENIDPRDS